jgi:hypothetical protein
VGTNIACTEFVAMVVIAIGGEAPVSKTAIPEQPQAIASCAAEREELRNVYAKNQPGQNYACKPVRDVLNHGLRWKYLE